MIEFLLLFLCLALLIKPVGDYLHVVYSGGLARRYALVRRIEKLLARLIGCNIYEEQEWKRYLSDLLIFLAVCFMAVMGLLSFQHLLPYAGGLQPINIELAFNITASFITGTNLQTYVPEATLSIISQNFGLTFLQFIAPAVDMAIAIAVFRAFADTSNTIGNFWQDMLRSLIFVLLPAALLLAIFNLSQGVVQSFGTVIATTLHGDTQEILSGPVASMHSISMLATNGGDYFLANAANPFTTPTPLAGFVNMLAIVLLPASFFYLFGLMIRDRRQGIMLISVISLCVIFFAYIAISQEAHLPPELSELQIETTAGNMEGKEMRFGTDSSALWSVLATATTNGSANSALDSYAPLSILAMMLQMLFGEVLFGGVGMGVINMLAVVIITVFMANLMIGRTPEYLRKKIGVFDIKLAMFMLVIPAVFLCAAISFSVYLPSSTVHMQSQDIHGYTESLYAIISSIFNNGSALGGISLNNHYYNILLGIGILIGSLTPKIIGCVLAGRIAQKQKLAVNAYSLQTHGVMFAILLLLVMIMGALAYLPILILGPISSHMQGLGV